MRAGKNQASSWDRECGRLELQNVSIREGCVGKAECNEGSSAAVTRESFMGNLGIGSS